MVKIFKSEQGKAEVIDSYNSILEMWSTHFEEIDVGTSYGVTHCIISGSKMHPPLLLMHGVGDNSAVMWALNIRELSKHFYCIAIDTIGGPGKSIPNENFTKKLFNQVDWINQIIDHFNLEIVSIAGVSNGAYMAYNYATKEIGRVHKVVCMEGGMITKPVKTMIQTILLIFPEILIPTDKNLMKILRKLSSPNSELFEVYPAITGHLILLMKYHNQQAMFVHKLEKYNKAEDMSIQKKLYFLISEHHINLKKDLMSVLIEDKFLYKVIANAGHGINHEQPDIVNKEITRFLLE